MMLVKLPNLPYEYKALEPYIDTRTMEIHYTKHHQAYVDKANQVLSSLSSDLLSGVSHLDMIKNLSMIPGNAQEVLRNNLGGHLNHSLFWSFLKTGTLLKDPLKSAIEYSFSSVLNFKKEFEKAAIDRFGSGWVWLIKNKKNMLEIISTANQDNPLMGKSITGVNSGFPIFGLDVWEHSYYLKYQNRRLDYVQSVWNVINWDEVSKGFVQKEFIINF